jgi:hypothetical protein
MEKSSHAFIAFMDILGYTSFIENSSTTDAAKIISKHLVNLKDDATGKYKKILDELFKKAGENPADWHKDTIDKIQWLVFSDTILLVLPCEEGMTEQSRSYLWFMFLFQCGLLYSHLFENGLPIRGAISYGEYYLEKNCFAGKGIIEAYKRANSLNLSAIVLSDSLLDKAKTDSALDFKDILNVFLKEYLIPLKDQKQEKGFLVIPPTVDIVDSKDPRQLVLDCFWQHRKDITKDAMAKVDNTETFFRSIRRKS